MISIDYTTPNWLVLKINNYLFIRAKPLIRGDVIDLGCGTAPFRDEILGQASSYTGVDWPGSLHGGSRVDVFADLAQDLPFRDACCHTITLFQVLEHVSSPWRLLPECRRILRPGGGNCHNCPVYVAGPRGTP
jgi:ubiquinone/menaquinone biosynthesis C-methylase UbiE